MMKIFIKNTNLNIRNFCKKGIFVSKKGIFVSKKIVYPYEIAESEEIEMQKIKEVSESLKYKLKKNITWGDKTIDME